MAMYRLYIYMTIYIYIHTHTVNLPKFANLETVKIRYYSLDTD